MKLAKPVHSPRARILEIHRDYQCGNLVRRLDIFYRRGGARLFFGRHDQIVGQNLFGRGRPNCPGPLFSLPDVESRHSAGPFIRGMVVHGASLEPNCADVTGDFPGIEYICHALRGSADEAFAFGDVRRAIDAGGTSASQENFWDNAWHFPDFKYCRDRGCAL